MGEMLTLQVTIFSVMAIGFLLKKIKLISARGQKEITDLVINLILPANIITSFMTEISTDTISDCAWIAVISIGIQLIALFYGNLFFHKENENRLKCLKYAIICSNAGIPWESDCGGSIRSGRSDACQCVSDSAAYHDVVRRNCYFLRGIR